MFATPMLSLSRDVPSTGGWTVVWGYRWLIFRILLGAGLIKIRGDQCWRDLTCMDYHYETQPVPGPTSRWYHQNPAWFHVVETSANHIVELMIPFLMLMGRNLRIFSGLAQVIFQLVLISSGNLSFLNWLTILPSLWCFDDLFLMDANNFFFRTFRWMLPQMVARPLTDLIRVVTGQDVGDSVKRHLFLADKKETGSGKRSGERSGKRSGERSSGESTGSSERSGERSGRNGGGARSMLTLFVSLLLALLLARESIPVVHNLLALNGRQAMNTNFNAFKIVNTYGAFGSITKERTEVVLEGTTSQNPTDPDAVWVPYEFYCKPGAVDRRPCLITPYHYRLDWLMWFAAFGNYQRHPWLLHLTSKLLVNDPLASSLLAHNPFLTMNQMPTFIRAEHYLYQYSDEKDEKNWWKRTRKGEYFPPMELANPSFQKFLGNHGWEVPEINQIKKQQQQQQQQPEVERKKVYVKTRPI